MNLTEKRLAEFIRKAMPMLERLSRELCSETGGVRGSGMSFDGKCAACHARALLKSWKEG